MTADSPLQVDEFPLPLLDGKKVNLSVLKSVLDELANLEAIPFEEVVWIGPDGKVVEVPQDLVDEWRFIGLNNRDFARIHFFKKSGYALLRFARK